ncbi:conserved membrane hypothetical protein [uncultured Desulfatiglans sp.]|nr:conserved membrane hypothetical protein [uncultured Desulfatiglans sp.]
MKVVIPAEGPGLDSRVSDRLGLSPYLLVVDPDSGCVEVVRSMRDAGSGAGLQVVARIIEMKSDVLLVRWCSPVARRYLSAHGVEVHEGVEGTAAEALKQYQDGRAEGLDGQSLEAGLVRSRIDRRSLGRAFSDACRQFRNLLPVMAGVVLLMGFASVFLPARILTDLFSGDPAWDSFLGACAGSLFAGNPVNSYLIGREMLDQGVSLIAVTAFMSAWVSVGLVQLPAEIAALGWEFALLRNLCCFGLSLGTAIAATGLLSFFGV